MIGFWDQLGIDEGGMPIHLPIGVTADGKGPTGDSTALRYVCWCGETDCLLTLAFKASERAALRSWLPDPGPCQEETGAALPPAHRSIDLAAVVQAEVDAALMGAADAIDHGPHRRGHDVSVVCSCVRCEVSAQASRIVRDRANPAEEATP